MAKQKSSKSSNGATVGYEQQLWQMADALRGSMDAAEYKHVVLGLIFLKYISDAFEEQHAKLEGERAQGADPEDPDDYRALNIFWVPPEARWSHLKAQAKQSTIGELVDTAMTGIERDNGSLKGVLPKDYARPALDKQRLGQLIDMISNISFTPSPSTGEGRGGGAEHHAQDLLGRIYEYFLSQFASAEGKRGGEFYTPRSVVKLLVEMIEPYNGRVYDPCCGSSGMFVQSIEFIHAHKSGNGNGGKLKSDLPAPRPGCFFVYAIRCDDDSIYIGHTDNLQRRWNEHCAGRGADWTKIRKPIRIVHYEEYASREEAVAREKELKTTNGRRWLKEEIAAGRARQAGGEPFEEKMKRLTTTLREQQAEAAKLDAAIAANLKELGCGG